MTTGQRLKIARNHIGLTQEELGKALGGIKQYKIKDMEIDKQKVSIDIAQKMEEIFSINFKWLLTGEGQMFKEPEDQIEFVDIKPTQKKEEVPVYEIPVSAGPGGFMEENHVEGYMRTLDYDFVVKIKGKSMEPLIPDGFFAAVKNTSEIISNKPLLVKYQTEPGIFMHAIKFVKVLNGKCELISANPEFTSIIPCDYLEVIGVIIGTFKGF